MKIRSSFVSNSSSSSFVMVVTKEAFDTVMANETPIGQAILNYVMSPSKVLGQDCMTYGDCSSDYWWDEVSYGDIIADAKARANGGPLTSESDEPTDEDELDDYLSELIRDNLGEYSVKASFKQTPKDQVWTYDMDW